MLPLMQDCVDDFLGVVSDYVDNGPDSSLFQIRDFPPRHYGYGGSGFGSVAQVLQGTTTSALVEARTSVDFLQLLIDASDEGADDSSRLEMLDPSSHPQESSPPGTTSSSSRPPGRSSPPTTDDHNCMVDTQSDARALTAGDDAAGDDTTNTTGSESRRESNEDRASRSRSQERPVSSSSTGSIGEKPSRSRSQERPPSRTTTNIVEDPPSRPHGQDRPPSTRTNNEDPPHPTPSQDRPPCKTNTSDNRKEPPSRAQPQERPHLTDDEVVANAYMFVLAGYETTANAIAFTSYTLARYPQWQELCVEELRAAQTNLTYEQVSCLHVLERVFQETLRIYPPVPSFVTREAGLTRDVGGVTIPSGVNVTVPVWHIHHDPALWPDPDKFDPDSCYGECASTLYALIPRVGRLEHGVLSRRPAPPLPPLLPQARTPAQSPVGACRGASTPQLPRSLQV
ncbi:hypothetical protein C7M84_000707 [Penaeus vannamei]|uniref:Cytochrome P450 n=1 Tax=Penaeus vannamei TaxID=6689 RepID=A0A3R7MER1_PENVA|nr:hypothetical protein C7M84_000707 [Penaeus vannamei]